MKACSPGTSQDRVLHAGRFESFDYLGPFLGGHMGIDLAENDQHFTFDLFQSL